MAPGAAPDACPCAQKKLEAENSIKPSAVPAGEAGTLGYRVHFVDASSEGSRRVSPWHSVPLLAGAGLVNMVCEIPRGTRAKFEVATGEEGNPIKQDVKKGKLRLYGITMEWNYGMLPQTWEDPAHASADCGGFVGDNDPVDLVDIGDHDPASGAVYAVKPIAALAMIDEGELDWKIVCVPASDPRSTLVNTVNDLETHFPGQLSAIREWFRTYKTHDGKPLNSFELNEEYAGPEYTRDVIQQTHGFWKSLVARARAGQDIGKLAVGDVPIITGCFQETQAAAAVESDEAATMKSLLQAMSRQEKGVQESLESLTISAPPMLGA